MEEVGDQMSEEEFWRTVINNLSIKNDLPDLPIEEDEGSPSSEQREILDKESAVLRLRLDLYIIKPLDGGNKAYMVTGNQKMEDLGIMLIREALEIIQKRKK